MIISPQTVSSDIAAMESRQGIGVVENDRSLEESGGSVEDESMFAKILAGLLKNAKNDVSGLEREGRSKLEDGEGGLSPEFSGPAGKRAGGKGGPEKIGPEENDPEAAINSPRALSRNKKSGDSGLLENFPELDEESALSEGGLLLGRFGMEPGTAPFEEEIPPGGNSDDSEEAWAAALAMLQVSSEGQFPATEEGLAVFGDIRAYLGLETAGGAEAPGKESAPGEDGGSLKDARSRDRKGFRGIVEDAPNFQRGLEKEASFTGMKKQALADNEGGRKDRLGEAKNRDKRRDRVSLEVQDFRGSRDAGADAQAVREAGHADEARPPVGSRETELTVELRSGDRGSESAATGGEKTASQAFEDILARELHQNLNNDIVRHASVVLKDGGEGTIKLSLKPESLGNVKIRLEMADNKITGHIIVESDEALRAFEREVSSLEQAFRESGFEGADLEMSLASGNGSGGAGEQWNEGEASPFFSERFAAERASSQYDALTERTDTPWAAAAVNGMKPGNGQISVNMLI